MGNMCARCDRKGTRYVKEPTAVARQRTAQIAHHQQQKPIKQTVNKPEKPVKKSACATRTPEAKDNKYWLLGDLPEILAHPKEVVKAKSQVMLPDITAHLPAAARLDRPYTGHSSVGGESWGSSDSFWQWYSDEEGRRNDTIQRELRLMNPDTVQTLSIPQDHDSYTPMSASISHGSYSIRTSKTDSVDSEAHWF